jgi:hypothetical protein
MRQSEQEGRKISKLGPPGAPWVLYFGAQIKKSIEGDFRK